MNDDPQRTICRLVAITVKRSDRNALLLIFTWSIGSATINVLNCPLMPAVRAEEEFFDAEELALPANPSLPDR